VEPGVCYTAIYVKQIKQIVSNFHRMFAYLCTISIQNFSCDKDKRFIVDFLSSKTRFSAQNANKVFGGPAPPEPARELPDPEGKGRRKERKVGKGHPSFTNRSASLGQGMGGERGIIPPHFTQLNQSSTHVDG